MIDYRAVLHDLEQQREGLDKAIEGVRRILAHQANTVGFSPKVDNKAKYAHMSVRWAILSLLAEADRSLPTGEITQRLLDGGMPKSGLRFNSNVSAVLSTMARKPEPEVEALDNGYVITPKGREVWEGIKLSPKYQSQVLPTT